jgi:putative Mg2+ transporter-C (MgtC) family protein
MTEMLTQAELIRRLLLAGAIGGLLGAERELRHKPAGFRTNILIGLGCAVFTILSISLSSTSPDRIASNIVTGVGFLGAGAIMRDQSGGVHGITTAATAWVNASLGTAAGAGHYTLAMIGGAITLAVLAILGPIEAAIEKKVGTPKS